MMFQRAHKRQNEVYSWSHWPCDFSMIKSARGGAIMAMGQAAIHVEHHRASCGVTLGLHTALMADAADGCKS